MSEWQRANYTIIVRLEITRQPLLSSDILARWPIPLEIGAVTFLSADLISQRYSVNTGQTTSVFALGLHTDAVLLKSNSECLW